MLPFRSPGPCMIEPLGQLLDACFIIKENGGFKIRVTAFDGKIMTADDSKRAIDNDDLGMAELTKMRVTDPDATFFQCANGVQIRHWNVAIILPLA